MSGGTDNPQADLRAGYEALRRHLDYDKFGPDQGGPCDNPEHIAGILEDYGFTVVRVEVAESADVSAPAVA